MKRIIYALCLVTCGLFLSFQTSAQCEAGTQTTTGTVTLCDAAETFDFAAEGETIPAGGGYGIVFYDYLGGTGALNGTFILQGTTTMETYDQDLNGILSGNGFPAFTGTWVVKGAAFEDPMMAFASICSITEDSLVVNFSGSFTVNAVNNTGGSASANASLGTPPYTYMWADGQTTQTATGLPMGVIGVTVTDANGCTAEDTVEVTDMATPCTDWLNPAPGQGWDLGVAPCDDGTGCPFNETTDFEVWASEAYSVTDFIAGGTYSFSMCNGLGAGNWVPEFTIIAPSGAIDAFGEGDGDACTITWTASEDGTYLIVINEADVCGGGDNTATDNGFPALTCMSGPEVMCAPVDDSCEAGSLTTNGEIGVCDDSTFDLVVEGDTIAAGGGLGYFFDNALGGTGALGGAFLLSGVQDMATYDNDLNGLLSANNFPLFDGTWVIKSAVYTDGTSGQTAFNTICNFSADSLIVTFSASPTLTVDDNGDGSATANPTGGIAPYTYAWADGQTTQTATELPVGSTGVTVTDANGCTVDGTVDIMVSVGNIEQLDVLNIAPNPTTGEFTVRMELNTAENVNLQLFDMTGRVIDSVVREQTTGEAFEFNMNDQAAGVYMLHVQVGSKNLTRRVVVNK